MVAVIIKLNYLNFVSKEVFTVVKTSPPTFEVSVHSEGFPLE